MKGPKVSLLSRLFSPRDDRAHVRPLWHGVVAIGRDRRWYARSGVADTVAGRFDALTLVLALVLLRMEREPALIAPSSILTELFITDMDGQLRQSGVGDLSVGKHIANLMSVLGGRLGALREALPDEAAVAAVIARNVTLIEGAGPDAAAALAIGLWRRLEARSAAEILAGELSL